jgi:hypothetical protein
MQKSEQSGLAIKGFQPNVTASSCLTVKGKDAREKLICRTFWAADGQKMTSISEVTVRRQNGTPNYEFRPILEARDTRDGRGANVVACEPARLSLFEIKAIAAGSAPGIVSFDASYAGRAEVERACAQAGRNARLGTAPLDRREAYIRLGDEQVSALRVDIHKGAIADLRGYPVQ